MKSINDIDNLLARHFSKESLTAEQEVELMEWISQNRKEYDNLTGIMDRGSVSDNLTFDTKAAWNKVEPLLNRSIKLNTHKIKVTLAYVASLVLLIGITVFWNKNSRIERFSYANSGIINESIILPDSSSVLLYPDSKIQYKAFKKKGTRQLTLTGKAFFNIKKKETRPFIIDAYDVKVEVLGTSFLIDAMDKDSAAVYVKTGIVRVDIKENNVLLKAGQQVKITKKEIIKSDIPDSTNIFGEQPAILSFNNTPIEEVVRQLENIFNVKIDLGKKIKRNRITSQLKIDNLSSILLELSYICDCKCDTISESHYKLYYP